MVRVTQVLPILVVEDLGRSLRFYRDRLGGEQIYAYPPEGEPEFVVLRYGATHIVLRALAHAAPHGEPLRPVSGHRIELRLYVDDVDAAVAELGADGIEIIAPATPRDWGERSGYVRDPDGNIVMLATPLELG